MEEQADLVMGVMGWSGAGLALPPEAISMHPVRVRVKAGPLCLPPSCP